MSDVVIQVDQLSKQYRLGTIGGKRLVDDVNRWWANLRGKQDPLTKVGKVASKHGSNPASETHLALQNVSFEVQRGEVLGIIGRNGAGKSTLLKILSRVTAPTSGEVRVKGRIASLLEVGTGFHPELTGRENIFLNGAILGLTKAEICSRFDEIVAFSGVEQFIDTPVKRYSSGMTVRLAFAVAAHLEPEILIVDEVLAVGDAEFQKKCLGKMKDVAGHGRTILFVSHNMQAVRTLCSSGLLLESGQRKRYGPTDQCVSQYESMGVKGISTQWNRTATSQRSVLSFELISCSLAGSQPSQHLLVDLKMRSSSEHQPAFIAVDILESAGNSIMQAIPRLNPFIPSFPISHQLQLRIELPSLIPGRYGLTLWVGPHNSATYDKVINAVCFDVLESPTAGRTYPHSSDHGHVVPLSACLKATHE